MIPSSACRLSPTDHPSPRRRPRRPTVSYTTPRDTIQLSAFTGPRPPSAQALADLLAEHETASRECSEALDEARSAIREAMGAEDLKLAGVRFGQLAFEDIDLRLIAGPVEIKESLNTIQGSAERWTVAGSRGERIEWNGVHVERQAFEKWRERNVGTGGTVTVRASSSSAPAKAWPTGAVTRAFRKRVESWPVGEPPPSEVTDLAAMKDQFPGLARACFRTIRRQVACEAGRDDWVKSGRRKKRGR